MKYQQLVAMPASVQDWLDHELEMRGIDAVVYTRYILSLLQQENFDNESADGELFPAAAKRNLKEAPVSKGKGKSKLRAERFRSLDYEEMRKSAAVECLMSVSEQKCGIEKLVDELYDKLKTIEGNAHNTRHEQQNIYVTKPLLDASSLTSSSPEEQAEKYYEAFPALSGKKEPVELPEAQNSEGIVSSVWDKKKVTQKEETSNENISSTEIALNELKLEDKEQENQDPEETMKGYFQMKTEIKLESDEKEAKDDWGTVDEIVKPSFIVPKYRTNLVNRHKAVPIKGKSPFNLPKQKAHLASIEVRSSKRRVGNTRINFEQHSEENTEESSLDNSFDEDYPVQNSISSNADAFEENSDVETRERCKEKKNQNSKLASPIEQEHNSNALVNKFHVNNEDEVLAKLAAKFDNSIAAIWSNECPNKTKQTSLTSDNIWQAFPSEDYSGTNVASPTDFPQQLRSLFSCASDPSLNSLWVADQGLEDNEFGHMYTKHEGKNENAAALQEKLSTDGSADDVVDSVYSDCASSFGKPPVYNDLMNTSLWKWHSDEAFIQGGVYGSVLPEEKWQQQEERAVEQIGMQHTIPLTDSEDDSFLESEIESNKSSLSGEDELQFVWNILGNLGSTKETVSASYSESNTCLNKDYYSSGNAASCMDDKGKEVAWQQTDERPCRLAQLEDKLVDLKTIWSSMRDELEPIKIKVPTPHIQPLCCSENETESALWLSHQSPQHNAFLTRSYDSYLNKVMISEFKNGSEAESAFRSEPSLFTKNCTLTYHKGESRFVEVTPSSKTEWLSVPKQKIQISTATDKENNNDDDNNNDSHENLLTSPKTHFRPIRQDSCETETTGSSENGDDQSGTQVLVKNTDALVKPNKIKKTSNYEMSQLYLGYKEECEDSSDELCTFPHYGIKSNIEKFCQTDEYPEAVEMVTEQSEGDNCLKILNSVIDVLDSMLNERQMENDKANPKDSKLSSKSSSPLSSKDENFTGKVVGKFGEFPMVPHCMKIPSFEFKNPLYGDPDNVWGRMNELLDEPLPKALCEWSTAQEEKPFWFDDETPEIPWKIDKRSVPTGTLPKKHPNVLRNGENESCCNPISNKSLRDEIKAEEEQLFEDIDQLRVLDLEPGWDLGGSELSKTNESDWLCNTLAMKLNVDNGDEENCSELEMINKGQRTYSSSDGEGLYVNNVTYSDYAIEMQNLDFFGNKLPVIPASKMLYSEELEEEWRKNGRPFEPKTKCKKVAQQKRPCSFYLEGNCRRSDCKFSHDLASITCRFWEDGSCFKGITCPFLHGYHSHTVDKREEKNERKPDFELESETHFPALVKPRSHVRKQELCHSSSSDSAPMTRNKRRRKRCPLKQRIVSPRVQKTLAKSGKNRQPKHLKRRDKGSSSDDDDTTDI